MATFAAFAMILAAASPAAAKPHKKRPKLTISVLSDRADLLSGGDALVAINLPKRVKPGKVRVSVSAPRKRRPSKAHGRKKRGARNVTKAFAVRSDGRFEGVVDGLPLGRSVLTAKVRHRRIGARMTLTNHPIGGPVFAGPQIQPWSCEAGATDAKCDQPPKFELLYLPNGAPTQGGAVPGTSTNAAGSGPFQSYDPKNPPSRDSIATTTTTDGVTVPFIVRLETGYMDRDQYAIATLFDPDKAWSATAPQRQFNHRLVITHGFSCDTEYQTGAAPSVLEPKLLGGGFIVMAHALDHAGHNCNLLTQAESLVMAKEYTIDHYGTVRWTIGSGCSGGSLVQQQVANAYPGIYQGITPQCSFTDAWSSAMQYEEYYFGLQYFQNPSRWDPGQVWDPLAITAVFDHPNPINPVTFTTVIPNSGNPTRACTGVPAGQIYNAQTNPTGVRCTLQDYMVNAFGRDERGFARRGFDNVGIQYGLKGLLAGTVSPSQFVDLNSHIGGADIDLNITPQRTEADPIALQRLYRTGAIDEANNLDKVAIIDLRGPDPGAFHDVYRTYAMRARLMRNFGTAANQVLWRGQVPLIGDPSYADDAVFAEDKWLARVDADQRGVPLARKIIEDKPDSVTDRCTDGAGKDVPEEVCNQTVSAYGTPRLGAGEPMTDDVMKCQLKPLSRDDYPVAFSDAQWARLQAAFPGGVCDYAKPGVDQSGAVSWLTYQDAKGNVIYGGKPLGEAPRSRPLRRAKRHH